MTTQGLPAHRGAALWAVALAIAPSCVLGGTIAGRITFPGRSVPAAILYARNLDTQAQYSQAVRSGEARFSFEVPAGRYWIFVQPEEPGLAGLYGAHTQFTACRHAQPTPAADVCVDHGLRIVEVAQEPLNDVDVDDWMLSDVAAAQLDQMLGSAPGNVDSAELGRPRFSEYRVPAATLPPATSVNLATDARAAEFGAQLQAAARAGSNFAGGFTLTRLSCGTDCDSIAVIDLRDGSVAFPEQLAHVSHSLPCRSERGMVFRDDSRLLEYTRREGESVVTDYLIWDPAQHAFSALAQYRRSLERFCAAATP